MAMKLVAAALLLAATSAYAQAPGETPLEPAPVAPSTDSIPVMANRWAVGLSAGALSIAPKDSPDDKTQFGIGQLSLRFRATYHLEIEFAAGGGQQQLDDGSKGDLDVATATLGLRYRFAAAQHWNWWLGAGIGALSVTRHDATDQEKQDAEHPMASVAIGIEHRWSQFALQAEVHGFAVGERQDEQDVAMPVTMKAPPPDVVAPSDPQKSGGMLTIGASYYF
jgi:hypothetical protein